MEAPRCAAADIRAEQQYEAAAEGLAEAFGYEPRPREESDDDWRVASELARLATRACGLCEGEVRGSIFTNGNLVLAAKDCVVMPTCAKTWAELHPEDYTDETGVPLAEQLPCGNEKCMVVVRPEQEDDGLTLKLNGECDVDRAGRDYYGSGRYLLDDMRSSQDFSGVEAEQLDPFDGQL